MRRDLRRAITPARRTTVAGDTGRLLPLAALVPIAVAAAIQAAAPTTRAAAAARTQARAVVARSQELLTADLTICALRRAALHLGLTGYQGRFANCRWGEDGTGQSVHPEVLPAV